MPKVLIIDDQQCVREFLAEELISEGYRVVSTGDARSATGHVGFSRPDLVLLDLYPDGPDGWEVLRDIKRQDPYLPIIIFSACDSFVDDPRLSQADGYVIKSIDLDELKHKIADVLRRKWAPRAKADAKSHLPQFSVAHGETFA
jgi:DNA-binding response OmpR family regulator